MGRKRRRGWSPKLEHWAFPPDFEIPAPRRMAGYDADLVGGDVSAGESEVSKSSGPPEYW